MRTLRIFAFLAIASSLCGCIDFRFPSTVTVRGGGDSPLEVAYEPTGKGDDPAIVAFVQSLAADPEVQDADRLILAEGVDAALYIDSSEDREGLHLLRGRALSPEGEVSFEIPGVAWAGFASGDLMWSSGKGFTAIRDLHGALVGESLPFESTQARVTGEYLFLITTDGTLMRCAASGGAYELIPAVGRVRRMAVHADTQLLLQLDPVGVRLIDGPTLATLWSSDSAFLGAADRQVLENIEHDGTLVTMIHDLEADPVTHLPKVGEPGAFALTDRLVTPDRIAEALASQYPLTPSSGFVWGEYATCHGFCWPLIGGSTEALKFDESGAPASTNGPQWVYLVPIAASR